jgi:predicted phosphoribosyltransferase
VLRPQRYCILISHFGQGHPVENRIFQDRAVAGRELANALSSIELNEPVVLGLPRGGVPVAAEVARGLAAPLDVLPVRKIGAPGQPELALGAVASGGVCVSNEALLGEMTGIDAAAFDALRRKAAEELSRSDRALRGERTCPDPTSRDVVLVDDGMATGATMRAAILAVRRLGAARIVVAVPTASPHAVNMAEVDADRLVCLDVPSPFFAVGNSYRYFEQTSDEEVRRILGESEQAELEAGA